MNDPSCAHGRKLTQNCRRCGRFKDKSKRPQVRLKVRGAIQR